MAEATTPFQGALAGHYRIERELGAGGMATVYLARDLRHDRDVAVKVLHPELGAALGSERFLAEIRTTARLQHPHILPLLDSGESASPERGEGASVLYYVMPYVAGETLRHRLAREHQLPLEDAVRIAREVAEALHHAHSAGIIHRDIKPENILLQGGHAVVADFGIALAVQQAGSQRMTQTGLSLGTPQYMSPEQAMGEKTIDGRTDIYALGAVLYEMLAGDPPFTGTSVQAIVAKVLAERPTPLRTLRDTVPPAVEHATLKALAKLPADRFESAKAFAAALANPAFGAGTMASSAPSAGRPAGVPRWAFAVATAVALGSLGVAAWGWMRPAPVAPVSRFHIVFPDSAKLAPNDNNSRIALSPDGRALAYIGYSEGVSPRWQIYLRRMDRLTAEVVPGTQDALNLSFSPDGKRIAFVSGTQRALKVVSLNGGPSQVLTDSLVDLGGLSWGSDGYIYYDGHLAGDGLARIRESGGPPEVASRPASTESWHAAPRALPNGRGVLMVIARDRGAAPSDIGVLDTRTGAHRVLVRGLAARYAEQGYLLYVTENGSLMAVRFDADRLTVSGEPVPLMGGVAVWRRSGVDVELATNGTLVYAAGEGLDRQRELIWVTRDGRVNAADSGWTGDVRGMAVSPDGRAVAVAARRTSGVDVWVKQLADGSALKITDAGGQPAWMPNGRDLAFSGPGGVFVGPGDGSTLPRLQYPTGAAAFTQIDVSPDGRWLVGTVTGDVYAVHTTGDSTLVPLVRSPALERGPRLSPDGRWLAYESDASGRLEVYVSPFPDVRAARRQISVNGGAAPRWSADGRELFFLTEQLALFAVPTTLSPTFSAGAPRALFSAAFMGQPSPYSVMPDGKRFLMTRRPGGAPDAPDQLIVVETFVHELKAAFAR